MSQSRETRFRQIMDGSDRSLSAGVLRAVTGFAEPIYSAVMRVRNRLYDTDTLSSHPLGRQAVSVGNITTGGTGKTPVVQWLANRLSADGQHPVILTRGYKTTFTGLSDEQALLAAAGFPVIANPDRLRGAADALRDHPETTIFILDDGMQHRRARRDFELVLVHAAEPFGFDRIFPRGLLRESLDSLGRADDFLITHADEVDPPALAKIISTLRENNAKAEIYQCDHVVQADLAGRKYFAFCGIGSPDSFFKKLAGLGGTCAGVRALDDHEDYSEKDISELAAAAQAAGAEVLITTAKDWVKVESFAPKIRLPILVAKLSLRFHDSDEVLLLSAIRQRLSAVSSPPLAGKSS